MVFTPACRQLPHPAMVQPAWNCCDARTQQVVYETSAPALRPMDRRPAIFGVPVRRCAPRLAQPPRARARCACLAPHQRPAVERRCRPPASFAVRHGETAWNVDTRIQGHLDIPSTTPAAGRRARWPGLADEPLSHLRQRPAARHATAQAIADATGAPLVLEPGLRERSFGTFEGRTFAEIEAELPEQARRWRQRDPHFAPRGGETLTELRERIRHHAPAGRAAHGELIVLVAHGGVLDALYRLATGQDLQTPRTWQLTNALINRLLWTPHGLTLVGWADSTWTPQPR